MVIRAPASEVSGLVEAWRGSEVAAADGGWLGRVTLGDALLHEQRAKVLKRRRRRRGWGRSVAVCVAMLFWVHVRGGWQAATSTDPRSLSPRPYPPVPPTPSPHTTRSNPRLHTPAAGGGQPAQAWVGLARPGPILLQPYPIVPCRPCLPPSPRRLLQALDSLRKYEAGFGRQVRLLLHPPARPPAPVGMRRAGRCGALRAARLWWGVCLLLLTHAHTLAHTHETRTCM